MMEYRGFLCCNQRISPLNIIASKAELIAPINVKTGVFRSIPNKINVPNPPAPINAAKVAVPMIKTKAVRIPEIMTGNAMEALLSASVSFWTYQMLPLLLQ